MPNLLRGVVTINYGAGSPGVNVWTFSPGTGGTGWAQETINNVAQDIYDAYDGSKTIFSPGVSIDTPEFYTEFDPLTGQAVGIHTADQGSGNITAAGSDNSGYHGLCICVNLLTDRWINGRRLSGRMYLGPSSLDAFLNTGTIRDVFAQQAADTFDAATSGVGPRLAIWHRPTQKGGSDGSYGDVQAVSVKRSPSYVKSRVY